uniref:Putative Phospholipase n=1 Tax=Megacormus gertschi TaxID=1843536 RepID=A0A224X3Q0_9SCOR
MNTLFVAIVFYVITNLSVKSELIIRGVQEALDGVSNFIDDISFGIKQVRDGLNTVEDIVNYAQGKPCEYKCPPGLTLKKNHYYKPIPQGCGAYGIQVVLSLPLLKDTEKCCDIHDICYGTCMSNKTHCDAEFGNCLYKKCEKQAKKLGDDVRKCMGVSTLFHMGVQTLGCNAFKSAQSESCICSSRDEL